jgi:nickel/cobalt transporter (NicO) family protein
MRRTLRRATLAAVLALVALPALASAHPLGNFTVNHYARITPSAGAVAVHWVLDMAEIPAFSEIRGMDSDHDGTTQPAERTAWLDANVPAYSAGLSLRVDGQRPGPWRVVDRALSFPAGQGGLSTLRLELDLAVPIALPAPGAAITFEDMTFADHIGWREIVAVAGAGVRVEASDVASASVTNELRAYPPDAASAPMDVRTATFRASADASAPAAITAPGGSRTGAAPRAADPLAALAAGELTPWTAGLAVLVAMALGAIHGVSPGHGKTLVAGYLIGSRGTLRQAVWLGLTVAISHTVGVLLLGAVTLGATALLLPERVIEWLALGSALLVMGLGASLVLAQLRHGRRAADHDHAHPHPHPPPHPHDDHGPALTTRALAALGIVGGIVPSASALLVLLVAVSLHRLAFGLLLVGAFGLGMAFVLAGISASVVVLRGRLARGGAPWLQTAAARRIGSALPLASGVLVVGIGLALTLGAAASLA